MTRDGRHNRKTRETGRTHAARKTRETMRHRAESPMPACVNSFIEPPLANVIALAPPVLNSSAWYTIYDAISGCQVAPQAGIFGEAVARFG